MTDQEQGTQSNQGTSPEAMASAEEGHFHYHVVLYQHSSARGELDRGIARLLQELLETKVVTPAARNHITVWLDTPGGDPHATYKIFLDLRGRCDRLDMLIPDYAKSAGTLLALGSDRIFMGLAAELGPLDAQIGHPDREDLIVSALDVAGSLEQLARMAVGITMTGGASALAYTGLPRTEVFKAMLAFSSDFLKPAVAKLDPHLVHRATEQLQVAKRYAQTMLAARKGVSMPLAEAAAEELLGRLVETYPEHGYIISRDEAKKLGLPVFDAEEHKRWPMAKALLKRAAQERKTILDVLTDEDLDKTPQKDHEPDKAPQKDNEQRGGDNAPTTESSTSSSDGKSEAT